MSTPRAALCLALLLVAVRAGAAAEPTINDKDLGPDVEIVVSLPSLGESKASVDAKLAKPSPVQMRFKLPTNWDRKRAMPVLCIYRTWNGTGPAFDDWNTTMGGANFIDLTVDYNASGSDPAFVNMQTALKVLEKSMAIDRSSLVVAGDWASANQVSSQFATDRSFCAAVIMSGGDPKDGHGLGGRPVLVVANREDKNGKTDVQPLSNYERQVALYDEIRKGGGPADLMIVDVLQWWPKNHGAAIKDWIQRAVPNPEIKRAYWIDRELRETASADRKRWCQSQLVSTWVEMPSSAAARMAAPGGLGEKTGGKDDQAGGKDEKPAGKDKDAKPPK